MNLPPKIPLRENLDFDKLYILINLKWDGIVKNGNRNEIERFREKLKNIIDLFEEYLDTKIYLNSKSQKITHNEYRIIKIEIKKSISYLRIFRLKVNMVFNGLFEPVMLFKNTYPFRDNTSKSEKIRSLDIIWVNFNKENKLNIRQILKELDSKTIRNKKESNINTKINNDEYIDYSLNEDNIHTNNIKISELDGIKINFKEILKTVLIENEDSISNIFCTLTSKNEFIKKLAEYYYNVEVDNINRRFRNDKNTIDFEKIKHYDKHEENQLNTLVKDELINKILARVDNKQVYILTEHNLRHGSHAESDLRIQTSLKILEESFSSLINYLRKKNISLISFDKNAIIEAIENLRKIKDLKIILKNNKTNEEYNNISEGEETIYFVVYEVIYY